MSYVDGYVLPVKEMNAIGAPKDMPFDISAWCTAASRRAS